MTPHTYVVTIPIAGHVSAKRNYPRASPRRRKYWLRLQCAAEKALMAAFHKANP
jgi:hypothetical protein